MPSRNIHDVIADLRARYDRGDQLQKPELELIASDNHYLRSLKEIEMIRGRYRDATAGAEQSHLLNQIDLHERMIQAYWHKVRVRAAEAGLI